MQSSKPRKQVTAIPPDDEDGGVEVRISTRAPKAKTATPPVRRASNLAVGLLEAIIGQLADYIETSPAVERLIRAQTSQVLRELAHDPGLTAVFREQVDQYIAELTAKPEILEPLVRSQVDRYLAEKNGKPPTKRRKTQKKEIPLD